MSNFTKYIEALQCLSLNRTGLPAVHSFGWQDVGEEHLCQLPEVEELISATAKGYMEVRAVFLQCSLLKMLCVLNYETTEGVCCFVSLW